MVKHVDVFNILPIRSRQEEFVFMYLFLTLSVVRRLCFPDSASIFHGLQLLDASDCCCLAGVAVETAL